MKDTPLPAIATRLAEWTSALDLNDVPDGVRHSAKRCIIDTIAVAVAGQNLPVPARVREHALSEYGAGTCTALGSSQATSATSAALVNGVCAHALDFDDTSYAGIVHASAVVLPAVLAAVQHAKGNGADLLQAFIAGAEATYAMGLTLTNQHYMHGWWATSTLGAVGAAAGAAKALKLDAPTTMHAIALCAMQTNGMSAVFGTDAKAVLAGQAARLGLESALLAARGITAPESAYEDRRGVLALMSEGIAEPGGLNAMGKIWRLLTPGVFVKRYPVCSAAQVAVELTQTIIETNNLDVHQIASVRCEVPHLVSISLVHGDPATPAQAQFSMPFAIGCILAFGELGLKQISARTLKNMRLQAAMKQVNMVESDDLNSPDIQPRYPECARVTITTEEGCEYSQFQGAATGMPENPLSDDALSEKFNTCFTYSGWPQERTHAVLKGLWALENTTDIGALLRENV